MPAPYKQNKGANKEQRQANQKKIKKEANPKQKPSGHDIILQNQNHTKRSYRKGIKSKSPLLLWATEKKPTKTKKKKKEILRITHRTEEIKSQEDQVVRWCNTGFPGCFPGLPPSPADIGHFQNLMLGKADLVGVFGVCVVRVDRLGVVWIFGRLWDLSRHIIGLHSSQIVCRRVTEPGCGGVL